MSDVKVHLSVTQDNEVNIVTFSDRKILEELSIGEIGDEFSKLVDGKEGISVLVSFKNVEHLSSAALGMLITLNKKIEGLKGTLKLSDINPQIYEVFKITRLNKLFDIYDLADEALSTF